MRFFGAKVTDLNGTLVCKDKKVLEEAAGKKFGVGRYTVSGPDAKKQFTAVEKPPEPVALSAEEVGKGLVAAEKNRSHRPAIEQVLRTAGDDPTKWYQSWQDDPSDFPEVQGEPFQCFIALALARIMRKCVKGNERVRAMQGFILSLPAQLQPQALDIARGVIAGFDSGRESVPKATASTANGAPSTPAPDPKPPTPPSADGGVASTSTTAGDGSIGLAEP